jgi:hypothetical protein
MRAKITLLLATLLAALIGFTAIAPAASAATRTHRPRHCHSSYWRYGYWAPTHIVKANARHSSYIVYGHWVPTKFIKANCPGLR